MVDSIDDFSSGQSLFTQPILVPNSEKREKKITKAEKANKDKEEYNKQVEKKDKKKKLNEINLIELPEDHPLNETGSLNIIME